MRVIAWVLTGALCLTVSPMASGCAPLPGRAVASVRKADYFASQRELAPEMARAIETGRLIPGMTPEQVWVVLGDPARKTRFEGTGTEVWVYEGGRSHVAQLPNGIEAFRVVFIEGRLVLVEPL